ncbi:MAG: NADH-quinone oxidoreductase subunit NuoG [Bacteroidales bacterium]|nr:NADH-quinone oxidoreductase subunit NuoG [Bacteroidales bacterium]
MAKIKIDGKQFEVEAGKNLLDTCLELGFDIPHFCFHPALGSVGSCRLCAVKKYKDEEDSRGRIVMSCMEPVTDGLIISTHDEEEKTFRAEVVESLMTNHPHDCPVCDEGGECHLQDMTVMTGHNYRQFDFKKRTYQNQELGPFIKHEMNRCIQCYRCVRFYKDYAGGKDLNVFASNNRVYFGRFEDGTLENEFSGNLTEVCPTGVFTDKTAHKHFTRKWDLSNTPSVCTHCSLGCNTLAGERYGTLRRIRNRYHGDINGYFLCDRGRFGYEFVGSDNRIKEIWKQNGNREVVSSESLSEVLSGAFQEGHNMVGIGSPRASLEANYSLLSLVGTDHFYHGVSAHEYELTKMALDFMQNSGIQIPTLKQMETADVVLILGEDLVNTAPRMALAVRQAARHSMNKDAGAKKIPEWTELAVRDNQPVLSTQIYVATPKKDSLDDVIKQPFRGGYSEIAALASSVAALLDKNAPAADSEHKKLASDIAKALQNAENPLIISGVTCGDKEVLQSACNVAQALLNNDKKVMLGMIFPESNSTGLSLFPGKPLADLFASSEKKPVDTLVVLENDLYRRAETGQVNDFLLKCKQVIVLDQLQNETTVKADVVLPAAVFSESEGTLVNNEGRAQRFYKAIPDGENGQARESWLWLNELKEIKENGFEGWSSLDDVFQSMLNELPAFAALKGKFPDEGFRMLGRKIPRESFRYSGRTSIHARESVSESYPPEDFDSPFAFSMEGQQEDPPSSLITSYWSPGWNSVQATNKYLDKPNGDLKGGNPGIRIFPTAAKSKTSYFKLNGSKSNKGTGEWQLFPVYQIFGSEELSAAASSLSERIKEPFLLLHPDDARDAGIDESTAVQVEIKNEKLTLRVNFENSLPRKVAGVSLQLPGMPFVALPGSGKITKM